MHVVRLSCLLAAARLCATAASADAGEQLARWMEAQGGLLGGEVREPPGKVRGLFATRDYEDGEVIGWLPFSATVPLPENGMYLLKEIALDVYDPASPRYVAGAWAPFWDSQPPLSQLASWDWLPDEALGLLAECEGLHEALSWHLEWHAETFGELQAELLEQRGGAFNVSWGQYLQLAMAATTRGFAFLTEQGTCCDHVLLPGFDMLNTGPPNSATRRGVPADAQRPRRVEMVAVGRVAAGDELTWTYHSETQRNDLRFLSYGYVREEDERLFVIDCLLPDGRPAFDPAGPLTDHPSLAGPDPAVDAMGAAEARAELRRLQAIAGGLTPLAADEAALAAAGEAWTHVSAVLRLRIARKRALAARAQALRARLAQAGAEEPAAAEAAGDSWLPLVAAAAAVAAPALAAASLGRGKRRRASARAPPRAAGEVAKKRGSKK